MRTSASATICWRSNRAKRARSPDRRDRLDPDRHAARRTGAARPQARAGHDVCGLGNGAGGYCETGRPASSVARMERSESGNPACRVAQCGLHAPSWPGLSRPSTSCLIRGPKDVDARDKRGHDEGETGRTFWKNWCRKRDSNPRPPLYESGALPTELLRRFKAHLITIRAPIRKNMTAGRNP